MPIPRPARRTRRHRLPVAVATAAVLLLVTGLAGATAAFWTLAGLAAVVAAVAGLAPGDARRPEPAAPSATAAGVPADDAGLATLLTL